MKKKYKLLLSIIGLLSISTITISSVISCSNGSDNSKNETSSNSNNTKNDAKNSNNSNSPETTSSSNSNNTKNDNNSKKQKNNSQSSKATSSSNSNNNSLTNYSTTLSIEQILNAVTTYFSNTNNQVALINYLVSNDYIICTNGTWNCNTSSSAPNGSGYASWDSALSSGISAFIYHNQNIYYDGVLGSNIHTSNISIDNASYSGSGGLVFGVAYNGFSTSSSVTISTTTLDQYSSSNARIANTVTTYFSNTNNQVALINYLVSHDYITYTNGTWNYNTSSSAPNYIGYTSWDSALSSGISRFIGNNQNISYDGVLGSIINVDQNYHNPYDLSITSTAYSTAGELVFSVAYNGISASSSVTISVNMLNNSVDENNNAANAVTTYFSNTNNQVALINYLVSHDYITYTNGTWNYNTSSSAPNYIGYTSWDSALSSGISAFIYHNQNIYYDGVLGSNIHTSNISIDNASYSGSGGLVFSVACNSVSASSSVTISVNMLNNSVDENNNAANAVTTYFSNTNNQMALINFLVHSDYITYEDGTWSCDNNSGSWASALSSGISAFIANNQNISYDGILGSNINTSNISIDNASYSGSGGLVFCITYNGINASSNITISTSTLSNYNESNNSSNVAIANAVTTYFSNSNNQVALIDYLVHNDYITYEDGTWSYDTVLLSANNYNSFTSWASALSSGIGWFIYRNENIYYNGVLGSSINVGQNYNPNYLSITSASYSTSGGLVFSVAYNSVNASDSVTISVNTLNNSVDENTNVANALTTYFSNTNNQMALINFLVHSDYITYEDGTWSCDNNSGSWASALSSGIGWFISNNQNISYDGILFSSVAVNWTYVVSITSASYNTTGGLVFSVAYNGFSTGSSITISTSTLDQCSSSNARIANTVTTYFSNTNNQVALINYLVSHDYITYEDGTWSYDNNSGYASWDSALSSGISAFIANNQNISYDGVLGSSINVGQNYNPNYLSITSASYSTSGGLVFSVAYNSVSASNSVVISTSTLNQYSSSSIGIANAVTTYFSNTNNQVALINYLVSDGYVTYTNGTWSYDNNSGYASWDSALSYGIIEFIHHNENIYYDGILGSNIYTNDVSIANVSYSTSGGLVFSVAYNGVSASNSVVISTSTLNQGSSYNFGITNAINTYFSDTNNQMALINYLVSDGYITYTNGAWSYDNNSGYASWDSALSSGISAFIANNQNISYDGVFGSSINVGQNYNPNYLSITSASYSTSGGLVFSVAYNSVSASSNITISTSTLNQYSSSNAAIANALTTYFSNTNNQVALINYLVHNDYITYEDGTWSYDTTSSSLNNYGSFTSWASTLSSGISAFIANNQNISYDGVLGSNIYTYDISITNASYSISGGLVFSVAYNGINASSNITISTSALNHDNWYEIVNAVTTYFSNTNNQMALINYLVSDGYITYEDGTWSYDNNSGYASWDSALSSGISAFIANNQNISYDGILGSSINAGENKYIGNVSYSVSSNLSIANVSYSTTSGLVFGVAYNGINASSNITISTSTLSNYNESNNSSNVAIANAVTTYFSNTNNQMALINYLVSDGYITYEDGTRSYDNNSGYASWDSALSSGISAFIANNQNISYDGVLGSSINVGQNYNPNYLSITGASYSTSSGLVFSVAYNSVSASSNITISTSTLNQYSSSNAAIANALTTYFSNTNNQVALINYLVHNDYITYEDGTWSYDTTSSSLNNYGSFTSWASTLSSGISAFIFGYQNISYDGILGSSINISHANYIYAGDYVNDLTVTSALYSTTGGLVFSVAYNGINASSNITISTSTLSNYNESNNSSNVAIANAVTTYFSNTNNQMALINYLVSHDYITYEDGTWSYDTTSSSLNNYGSFTSWASTLSSGISAFIANNKNISYDGVLGSNIHTSNISIDNASYSGSGGLVFGVTYNSVSANNNIKISLNEYFINKFLV